MSSNKAALIIDVSYLVHRCLSMPDLINLRTKNGIRTGGIFGTLRSINSVISKIETENIVKVICCFDSYPEYRKSIFPEYKGNRKSNPDSPEYVEYHKKDEWGWSSKKTSDFTYETLKTLLPKMKVRILDHQGLEGDDLVYQSAKYLQENEFNNIVLSDDKDFLQLCYIVPNTSVYRVMANEYVTLNNFKEIVGVKPEWFIVYKSLLGDSSDNIQGVASGFGGGSIIQFIEKAEELGINPESNNIANELLELSSNWEWKNKNRIEKFDEEAKLRFELNLKLIDFRKCPYKLSYEEELNKILIDKIDFDYEYLMNTFKEFEFKSLASILTSGTFRRLT